MRGKKSAFTLIEVLTTIAIIGILFAITSYVYGQAQQRSRDQQRLSNVDTINNALEQYYLDNRSYPALGKTGNDIFAAKFQFEAVGNCTFSTPRTLLVPQYLSSLPEDPQYELNLSTLGQGASCNTNQFGQYLYIPTNSTGSVQGFYLAARLEQTKNMSPSIPTGLVTSPYYSALTNVVTLCDQSNFNASACGEDYYRQNNAN